MKEQLLKLLLESPNLKYRLGYIIDKRCPWHKVHWSRRKKLTAKNIELILDDKVAYYIDVIYPGNASILLVY